MISSDFRRRVLYWYSKNGRDLPWRHTRDPYAVLVSEFMLQQTQVATVISYYNNWLRRYPDFPSLARAHERSVLRSWEGLGYYSRARNLHATAKIVANRYRGQLPQRVDELTQLPGIGKYTAHAVATFAFDQAVPIVEANTSRVLARLFNLRIPIDALAGQKALWEKATSLVPQTASSIYNSALLDLGALICLPRNPKCGVCPVRKFCRAKNPESLPIKNSRPETKSLVEKHAFVSRQGKILLQRAVRRWRGMWILPALNGRSQKNGAIHQSVFPFTRHRITLRIFPQQRSKIDSSQERWFGYRELKSIPIPSPHRRAINALLN